MLPKEQIYTKSGPSRTLESLFPEREQVTWIGKHKVPIFEITEVKLKGLVLHILKGQAA